MIDYCINEDYACNIGEQYGYLPQLNGLLSQIEINASACIQN